MPASARISASASRGVEPGDLGRAGAGRERRVDHVDVEAEERGRVADALAHAARVLRGVHRAQLARPPRTSKPSARASERSDARVQRAAHAGQQRALRAQQPLLHRAPERRAVEVALAVVLVPRVGVRVEQHQRDRAVDRGMRAQLAEHDRVVAAQHERHDAGAHDRLERRRRSGRRCARRCRASRRGRPGRPPTACRTRPRRAAGGRAAGRSRRARIASGPNRAPGRRLVAVSNGTPTTATSTPSSVGHVRAARERAHARVAGRLRGVGRAVGGSSPAAEPIPPTPCACAPAAAQCRLAVPEHLQPRDPPVSHRARRSRPPRRSSTPLPLPRAWSRIRSA